MEINKDYCNMADIGIILIHFIRRAISGAYQNDSFKRKPIIKRKWLEFIIVNMDVDFIAAARQW